MTRLSLTAFVSGALLLAGAVASADLYESACQGDVAFIDAMVKAGGEALTVDQPLCLPLYGQAPLHGAAAHGQVEAARWLIEHGAFIDHQDDSGETPLHEAAAHGQLEVVRLLLEHGADPTLTARQTVNVAPPGLPVEMQDKGDLTALDYALGQGHAEIVRLFVEHGAEVTMPVAVALGDLERVRAFLAAGPTPEGLPAYRSYYPLGPLINYAAAYGQLEIARLLLEPDGPATLFETFRDQVSGEEEYGPGITLAARGGHPEMMRLLEQHKALLTVADAARCGDLPLLQEVLDRDPEMLSSYDWLDWLPLGRAAAEGRTEAVEFLLEQGAEADQRDMQNQTALDRVLSATRAPQPAKLRIIETLLSHGADVNAGPIRPLSLAAQSGDLEAARLLLQHGAKVDAKDANGGRPLHGAACQGDCALIGLLLDQGADVNAKTGDGVTPLHLAAWRGNRAAVNLLLARGAEVDPKADMWGFPLLLEHFELRIGWEVPEGRAKVTPLAVAVGAGFPATCASLIVHGANLHPNIAPRGGAEGDLQAMGALIRVTTYPGHVSLVQRVLMDADPGYRLVVADGAPLTPEQQQKDREDASGARDRLAALAGVEWPSP